MITSIARSALGLSLLLVALPSPAPGQEKFLLQDNQRVLFLGDSNTFAGTSIAYIDAFLFTRFPTKKFDFINLGLPSETVSGLSEPDHPFPRPNVHDRLDRALAETKPHVVVVSYGMNDGIYYPFSAERFAQYQQGIQKVVEKVTKAGAKVILCTPAPFDPVPLKKVVRPLGAEKYSWMNPYEKYDETLDRYALWLVSLRDKGFLVADPHTAIRGFLEQVRQAEPGYVLSGDGIHPNPTGHALIAFQILHALNAPDEVDMAEVDCKMKRGINGNVKDVVITDKEIRFVWTSKMPLPHDRRWHPKLIESARVRDSLNRHELIVTRAPATHYVLFEGEKKIGAVSRAEIKIGLDMTRFPELSTNQRAATLWKLVEERQKILGLAWLSHVGHKRPSTPKGLPLDEARKQAERLEQQIRMLAEPQPLSLRLVRKEP